MIVHALAATVLAGQYAAGSPEDRINSAFRNLSLQPAVTAVQIGSETFGTQTRTFDATFHWHRALVNGRDTIRLEALGNENGLPAFRIVGDGTTLWAYDAKRHEYSASRYGTYEGAQPEGYRANLLKSLGALVRGRSVYAYRLLNESFGPEPGAAVLYRSWMPPVAPVSAGDTVLYQTGNPVRRRIIFTLPLGTLTEIEYYDRAAIGGDQRTLSWSMTVTSGATAPPGADFTFVPPAAARPVSGLRPVTGG